MKTTKIKKKHVRHIAAIRRIGRLNRQLDPEEERRADAIFEAMDAEREMRARQDPFDAVQPITIRQQAEMEEALYLRALRGPAGFNTINIP